MFREYPDMMTVAQVAEALGVGKKAVYDLIHKKHLGHIPIGKNLKIPKHLLVEYINTTARNNIRL